MVREAVVGRVETGSKNKIRVRLGDGNASVLDLLRQAALRRSHAVLNVNRCDVQVVSGAERHIDVAGAIIRACRSDVVHALDAVDLLLQWSRNRGFDHIRVCAHVVAGNGDLRRRQVRI